MKWNWLNRHHDQNEIDPEVDAQVKEFVDAAEARQEQVDYVVSETRRHNKTNNFGPKVATALGARPR